MKTNDIPLKSPIKLQQEMQKKKLNFPKFVRFLGHFLKKQCFWKMGVAGIKQLPRPSKIASFSWKLNGEALLKVSLKNIDRFQKYKGLKSKIVKKAQFPKENGINPNPHGIFLNDFTQSHISALNVSMVFKIFLA